MKKGYKWADNMSAPDNINELARAFRHPPAEFRPVPFWFWNGDPTDRKTVRAQILEMKARGIGGVMPMPIYGLDLPYCGDEWYAMMRYAADVCAQNSMTLWIYDEFHCPSGTCAGHVLRDNPEYNRTALLHNSFKLRPRETLTVPMRPSWMRTPELTRRGEELFAAAPALVFAEHAGRSAPVHDYTVECVDAPAGSSRFPGKINRLAWCNRFNRNVTLHVFTYAHAHSPMPSTFGTLWATHEPGYIDVLNPRAVEAFLLRTFDDYDRLLGRYYGNVVPGVFTDEPGLHYGFHSKAGTPFPYTPALFDLFREQYKYDIREHLPALAADIGDFRRVRADYWRLVTRLFSENYNRLYARWCEKRGLIYTGHFSGEERLKGGAFMNGDIFTVARQMHIPGLDLLRTETPYDNVLPVAKTGRSSDDGRGTGQIIATKILAAAAHAAGSRRIICEANGVPNWSVTLGDLKHLADWLCGMGVSLMNDNGVPYSVKDIRGMAGRSLSVPWWPFYRHYADYTARLSLVMSAGNPPSRLAVLYPTTAVWTGMACEPASAKDKPEKSTLQLTAMQEMFSSVMKCLTMENCECDLIFEDILSRAGVRNANLVVRDRRYRILVIAGVETLEEDCFQKIVEFRRGGGIVAVFGSPPRFATGCKGSRAIPSGIWRQQGVMRFPGRDFVKEVIRLTAKLDDTAPEIITVNSNHPDKLQVSRRVMRDGSAVLIVNHAEKQADVTISSLPGGDCREWCPETGAMRPFGACVKDGMASLKLAPRESKLLIFCRDIPRPRSMPAKASVLPCDSRGIRLPAPWDFKPQTDNLLPLAPRIAFDFNDVGIQRKWYAGGGRVKWEALTDGAARSTLAPDIMAAYWLMTDITVAEKPERLLLYQDGGTSCRVFVNGRETTKFERRQLWDPDNICFDLSACMQPGRNRIVLRVTPSLYLTQAVNHGREVGMLKGLYPMPAALAGDFVVEGPRCIRKWKLPCRLRDGSWTNQGFPAFTGCGRYKSVFKLKHAPGAPAWIELPDMRDVVTLRLNGRDCGTRAWSPYLFEISDVLRCGDNELEIDVFATFGNILRRHYFGYDTTTTPAGLLGGCRLIGDVTIAD